MSAPFHLPPELPGADQTLTGQCHCKSVNFTVTIPTSALPLPVHICHCHTCRYLHGTPCVFHAPLPNGIEPDFIAPSSLSSSLTGYLHHESPTAERFFCSTCGCHVGDRKLDPDPETGKPQWHVATSIITPNSESHFQIRSHIFAASREGAGVYSWLHDINGRRLRTWHAYPEPHGEHESKITPAPPAEPRKLDGGDEITAECHCSGVKFTVARPTEQERTDPFLSRYVSRVDGRKRLACLCVCADCRLVSGTHVTAWTFAPLSSLKPEVPANFEGFGTLKAYRSSENVIRGFCAKCGATILYSIDDEEHAPEEGKRIVDIAVGILRAPEGDVAAEEWLTWRTGRLAGMPSGKEYDPGFAEGLKKGLAEWGSKKHGKVLEFNIPLDVEQDKTPKETDEAE